MRSSRFRPPISLTFAGALLLSAAPAGALTWSVSPGSPGACTVADPACATISAAVAAASAGDVISIGAGSYVENVVVTKPLELAGAGEALVNVLPAVSNPNPCSGGSLCGGLASNVFLVRSPGVTIRDLIVDGDNPLLTSGVVRNGADLDARNGIIGDHGVATNDGLVVRNVTVRNVYLRGIYPASGSTGFDVHDNTVRNVAGDWASIALFSFDSGGRFGANVVDLCNDAISSNWSRGILFEDNVVTNCASGVHTDNPGSVPGSAPDVIEGNDVSLGTSGSWGIWTFVPYTSPIVRDNVVSGVDVALGTAGSAGPGISTTFLRNSADCGGRPAAVGFYVTTDEFGFGFADVSATLTSNSITGCPGGAILLEAAGPAPTPSVTVAGSFNRFAGNGAGVVVAGTGPISANLPDDWWGCNGGPGVCAGSSVATGVVSPWLVLGFTAGAATVPTFGSTSLVASLTRNSLGADTSGAGTVLDGIPATFGGTLGSAAPPVAGTLAGLAGSSFVAGGTGGAGGASVTVDSETFSVPLTVTPALTLLSPSFALVGGAGFTLTVDGVGFPPAAVVRWNGVARATTWVSGTRVTATIPASDLATTGDFAITVTDGGAGVSNALPFAVLPRPSVVWVDDDWSALAPGVDPDGAGPATLFGWDGFAALQPAVDTVTDGGEVRVHEGIHAGTLDVVGRTDLLVTGIGASRDTVVWRPTTVLPWNVASYGTSRKTVLRVVDSTGIDLSALTLDLSVVRANFTFGVLLWNSTGLFDDVAFENAALPDASGGYYEFVAYLRAPGPAFDDLSRAEVGFAGCSFTDPGRVAIVSHDFVHVTVSASVFEKVLPDFGYGIEIGSRSTGAVSGSLFTGFGTPAASDGSASAAIYVENAFTAGLPHCDKPVSVIGCELAAGQHGLFIGNESAAPGLAAGDVDVVVSLVGTSVHDNSGVAVRVVDAGRAAGSSVTVLAGDNALLDNALAAYSVGTIGSGDATLSVLSDTILRNGASFAVATSGAGPSVHDVSASFCRIVDNGGATNGTADPVVLVNDWWGCNAGPNNAGCEAASAGAVSDPRMVLELSATPTLLGTGETSALLARLRRNSDGIVPAGGALPEAIPVSLSGVLGTVVPGASAFAAGERAGVFTAGGVTGDGSASATTDHQTVSVPLSIGCRPTERVSGVVLGVENGDGTATFSWSAFTPTDPCHDHYQVWAGPSALPLDPAWGTFTRVDPALRIGGSAADRSFRFDLAASAALQFFLVVESDARELPGPEIAPPAPTGP